MSPISISNPSLSQDNRDEIAFLTQSTYVLRQQVWKNLTRMSALISRKPDGAVSAEQLDGLFRELARDMELKEVEQATLEDLLAGIGRQS